MTSSRAKVTLYPWDPMSPSHREWLYNHRVECGWDKDKVQEIWKEQQIHGDKCIYWIVLQPNDSEKLDSGKTMPEGQKMLHDTATSINGVPREPSQASFFPIGHISLDPRDKEAEKINLDMPTTGVYWIKTFFVLQSMQNQGIGRAAMDEVESIAVTEPLWAKTLMLDTITKDDQMREEFAKAAYGTIPKTTTEDWYTRRGYRAIGIVQNFHDVRDRYGKKWDMKTIFMRKDIQ